MLAQTISLSIPLVAILAGIFLNHQALRELKADLKRELKADLKKDMQHLNGDGVALDHKVDGMGVDLNRKMDGVAADLNRKIDGIGADLRPFYPLSGKLEGRLDTLEKRVA